MMGPLPTLVGPQLGLLLLPSPPLIPSHAWVLILCVLIAVASLHSGMLPPGHAQCIHVFSVPHTDAQPGLGHLSATELLQQPSYAPPPVVPQPALGCVGGCAAAGAPPGSAGYCMHRAHMLSQWPVSLGGHAGTPLSPARRCE
eukprot:CAMPEP_0181230634 /NCGR_PEP_ID=MMETSP1096-20121128/34597_1 /TAXON_ID=156174 ORGANISM="Chrysochromulina ericina, Strain CCMP281" /NCGR_SAMPLE_ID=MMETSP1096 /ASSEMBLY_ACC=CAM_ASM_000453 /LENGTH=142 /DNA_ID=CAMNT_0023324461 /DNA_START=179 /DNA_END=607 /DNA_ORIENTATION=-